MKRSNKPCGEMLGTVLSRALISITVTIINFWGKSNQKWR